MSRALSEEKESAIGKYEKKVFQGERSTRAKALGQEQAWHIRRKARQLMRVNWSKNGNEIMENLADLGKECCKGNYLEIWS